MMWKQWQQHGPSSLHRSWAYHVEGDSLMVINTLNSKEESLASYGHFLEVVLPSLVSFSSVSFSHVPRVGNNIAYNLTKYARNVSGLLIWMKDVPSHLHAIFVADYG